tara:strand:+ start:6687 stop:7646 length:960 start_codon:yes stop_codon:yes gene_type:complete
VKIVFIGPGYMSIPPKGWGAVESLVDDYRNELIEMGHEAIVINTTDLILAAQITNGLNPDFVHIQYDDHIQMAYMLNCKNIGITSHYAYLESSENWTKNYRNIFWWFVNSGVNLLCLSEGIQEMYRKAGVKNHRLHLTPNGVKSDLYEFHESPKYPDRSIYLAKIDFRKRQHLFQGVENLYFAGPLADDRFDPKNERYLGEWPRSYLTKNLTNYASLVLLSDGEAHPLVCLEGMVAGLGLVLSKQATANLDTSLPFIEVVPEEIIQNEPEELQKIIKKNREISRIMRKDIRDYALSNFTWKKVINEHYIPTVSSIVKEG